MIRRFHPSLRKTILVLIYATALVVWVALVVDTVGLAEQAAAPPRYPTATSPAVPSQSAVARGFDSLPRAAAAPTAEVLRDITSADQRAASFHPKTGRYISAWLPDSFDAVNRQSFEANADILDEVSPFWYTTNARGDILRDGAARDQTLVELAHSKNVLVVPTIHNIQTTDPVPSILRSPERRARHVQLIVDEVVANNYDGIDIDYELLDSELRDAYSAFIGDLAQGLHAHGKLLTVAVHAKTSDYGGLGGFQDWVVLGKVVDRLRIMTYDYHWRGGGPGPVAPIYWVRAVAEYAKSVVDPAKVVIGVPFYGYNWPAGGSATPQTWDAINNLIQSYGLTVNLTESDANGPIQENWIAYGGRKVWFATSRSLEAKLGLVQQMDLAGIAIWRLGGEDPQNWVAIRSKLVEDPFESQRMVNQVLPEH